MGEKGVESATAYCAMMQVSVLTAGICSKCIDNYGEAE